jgi:hypothetical protein
MSLKGRQSAWAAVEAYVLARAESSLPVSTKAAVQHLKEVVPHCEHTDDELVQLVAISAVRHGRGIAFDGPFGKPDQPPS